MMRLKKHREDCGWLRSHGILSMEKQEEIASRYHRLILAMEEIMGYGMNRQKYWEHEQTVMKDAEK